MSSATAAPPSGVSCPIWYFTGAADDGWDTDILDELKSIPAGAFEAVDASSLMVSPDSGQVRGATAQPAPSWTVAPSSTTRSTAFSESSVGSGPGELAENDRPQAPVRTERETVELRPLGNVFVLGAILLAIAVAIAALVRWTARGGGL